MISNKVKNRLVLIILFYLASSFNLRATNYYVNDGFTVNDVFCVVSGTNYIGVNAVGRGLSPSTPVLTLKYLFAQYGTSFAAGDNIYIDAGIYAKAGTPSVTNESKFTITTSGLSFIGAGVYVTKFDNMNHSTNTDFFMDIKANNITLKEMTITRYSSSAPNSGSTYDRGSGVFNTGGQAISISGATGVIIDHVNTFNNGNGGNGSIGIGPATTATLTGGGSNCNATGSSYSGGIDIYGNNINVTISNYMLTYNSKSSFNGAGLMVYGVTASTIVKVYNTVISNNTGGAGDGIIHIDGCNFTMRDCQVLSNTSSGSGGPYYMAAGLAISGGTVKINKTLFQSNSAATLTKFGGIGVFPTTSNVILSIDSCKFLSNGGINSSGKDLGARIGTASRIFSITVNQTSFDNYGANKPIEIGGGSGNSCSGSSFVITNSGNPSIAYSGSPICSIGAGSNTNNVTYSFVSPIVPTFSGPCASFLILPIELTRFEANCNDGSVLLTWQTASEKNNNVFNIERSIDGVNFEVIGTIRGAGNSESYNNYSFLDAEKSLAVSYYRLSQIDYNGKKSQSNIISVDHSCGEKTDVEIAIYPNPALNNTVMSLKLLKRSSIYVEVYNGIGQLVKLTSNQTYEAGLQDINLETSEFTSGIYFIKTIVDAKEYIQKFVKL